MDPIRNRLHRRLSAIADAVRALPADNALIDGEAVVFRPDGHSDFAALRTRAGGEQAALVAFDLINFDGEDFRQRPLEKYPGLQTRKAATISNHLRMLTATSR